MNSKRTLTTTLALITALLIGGWASTVLAAETDQPWVQYQGSKGKPGTGKHVVLISGDDEYRSEEALTMLGKILAKHHGFTCTVLFAVNPQTGEVDPPVKDNIPGLEHLATADLCFIATRRRNLPDEQMKHFVDYVNAAKPIIGLRTATHAFTIPRDRKYAAFSSDAPAESGWEQGFGRQVLGETWVNHHVKHGVQGTHAIRPAEPHQDGVDIAAFCENIYVPTDVYQVRLPLTGDARVVLLGEVTQSLEAHSPAVPGEKNAPMMPVAWARTYTSPVDPRKTGRAFTCTMGAAVDLLNEGLRRLLVNAAYWCCGMEDQLKKKQNVALVDPYNPTWYGFDAYRRGLRPSDYRMGQPIGGSREETIQGTPLYRQLKQRAKAIEPMLAPHANGSIPTIEDRAFWESLAKEAPFHGLMKQAERFLNQPIPELPDELYLEFFQNGNRSNYQRVLGQRGQMFNTLLLAECFENQGRFLPKIESLIRAFAADKSWVLPAHDYHQSNFHGQYTVDLVSSSLSWNLATWRCILGDRLSPEIRELIQQQLKVRTFQYYNSLVMYNIAKRMGIAWKADSFHHGWWLNTTNNWNAVCLCGVTGAALAALDSVEERAWYIAVAEYFLQNSVIGYLDDGYCTEGMGYWNYGFGHHIALAELIRRNTNGQIRLLDVPKLRKVALYGFNIQITPGTGPCFADCSLRATPSVGMLDFLNRYYGLQFKLDAKNRHDRSLQQLLMQYTNDFTTKETQTPPYYDIRSWFPDAQVLISRPWNAQETPSDRLFVAMKGGNNAEHHNHNDLGSYLILHGKTQPALDLGGEVYTRDTFGANRYNSDVLNSWGHNVPVVAGKLQKKGPEAQAKVLTADFTNERDTLELELTSAYEVPQCAKLTRTFVYDRTGQTTFSVTDAVTFTEPQTFETALVTALPYKREGNTLLFGSETQEQTLATLEVRVNGQPTDAWTLTESGYKADFPLKNTARRLGITLNEPVQNAEIRVTFQPKLNEPHQP